MNKDILGNTLNEKAIVKGFKKNYNRRILPFDDQTEQEAPKISFLTPTHKCPLEYKLRLNGKIVKFECVLDCILWMKARVIGGEKLGQQVYNEQNTVLKTALIDNYKSGNRKPWLQSRVNYIYQICLQYVETNPDVKEKLFSKILRGRGFAYCHADEELAIGFGCNDRRLRNTHDWTGLNLIGAILTKIRDDSD